MSTAVNLEPDPSGEPTIGRLIADTTSDLSSLVRDEIALAKSELTFSAKAGGIGAALFAVAAFFGLLAIIMVSIAFAYALASLPHIGDTVAFLIVFAVYLLIAAILAFVGLRKIKQVRAPEKTIATMKSNTQVLKRS
jgi:Putative Actinobacterial Holin-X, holin superfamily III